MTIRPRPLIAVRIIGLADEVAEQKAHLIKHLTAVYGDGAVCRVSTHRASYANEIRVYVTVTRKEVPPR